MASLIELKREVEQKLGRSIKVTFTGASEAHLLAQEIGAAKIGVIISPSRPYPTMWEMRRMYVSILLLDRYLAHYLVIACRVLL